MCNGCKIPFGLARLDSSCAWLLTLCALWNGTKHEAVVLITRYKSANCCGPNYVRYNPILKTRSTLNRSHVYEMIYIFTNTNIIIFFFGVHRIRPHHMSARAHKHTHEQSHGGHLPTHIMLHYFNSMASQTWYLNNNPTILWPEYFRFGVFRMRSWCVCFLIPYDEWITCVFFFFHFAMFQFMKSNLDVRNLIH